ncbi:hypothetical protein C0J52_17520 [Blattella germanica]|nr:hypothetical protein C0J52_17520 [Blattella germanica]
MQQHNTLFHAKDFNKHKDNKCTCVENLKCELHNKDESGRSSVARVSYKIALSIDRTMRPFSDYE